MLSLGLRAKDVDCRRCKDPGNQIILQNSNNVIHFQNTHQNSVSISGKNQKHFFSEAFCGIQFWECNESNNRMGHEIIEKINNFFANISHNCLAAFSEAQMNIKSSIGHFVFVRFIVKSNQLSGVISDEQFLICLLFAVMFIYIMIECTVLIGVHRYSRFDMKIKIKV